MDKKFFSTEEFKLIHSDEKYHLLPSETSNFTEKELNSPIFEKLELTKKLHEINFEVLGIESNLEDKLFELEATQPKNRKRVLPKPDSDLISNNSNLDNLLELINLSNKPAQNQNLEAQKLENLIKLSNQPNKGHFNQRNLKVKKSKKSHKLTRLERDKALAFQDKQNSDILHVLIDRMPQRSDIHPDCLKSVNRNKPLSDELEYLSDEELENLEFDMAAKRDKLASLS